MFIFRHNKVRGFFWDMFGTAGFQMRFCQIQNMNIALTIINVNYVINIKRKRMKHLY